MPFEIPESWEWVKLTDVAFFGGGKTPSMNEKKYWQNGTNLWITSKDMKCDRINDSAMKISDEALSIMTLYRPGTILLVTRSGILRHSLPLAILEKEATVNQDLKTITFYLQEINTYVFYSIKANERFILKEYHKDGTTVDSINFEDFSNILLPLPPKEEQFRIINCIEKLFTVINGFEYSICNLTNDIKQAKCKILDLAIHGKLVPQDPTDESANELLKRIAPNAKPCDTSHYGNIPLNWCVCTLKDIFEITMGSSPSGNTLNREQTGIEFHQGKTCFTEKYVANSDIYTTLPTKTSKANSILLCVRAPVGVVNIAERDICIGRGLCALYPKQNIDLMFAFYAMQTYQSTFDDKGTGTTFKAIGGDTIRTELFLLPPYNEQIRIRKKLDEVFASFDTITAML